MSTTIRRCLTCEIRANSGEEKFECEPNESAKVVLAETEDQKNDEKPRQSENVVASSVIDPIRNSRPKNDSQDKGALRKSEQVNIDINILEKPPQEPPRESTVGNPRKAKDTSIVRQAPKLASAGPLSILNLEEFLVKAKIDFEKLYKETLVCDLKISDFTIIKVVGKGTYGKVILAELKSDENYYAIKLIDKKDVVQKKYVRYVLNEKRVLQSINFPFLVHLKFCFADFKYMYFVMPFVPGGDFNNYLHYHKPLKESKATFYIGQLILALEYLHYMGLIHRDVKPENIILDMFGYIKLGDFGHCTKCRKNEKTWTIAGTPEYMAPEVIVGKGYDCSVDWWSLGVVTFEMCAGRLPFQSDKAKELYKLILTVKYHFPDCFSRQLKNFVRGLLVSNPSDRIANHKYRVTKIKEMPWVKKTDWLALLNRTIQAPFVPDVTKVLDGKSK